MPPLSCLLESLFSAGAESVAEAAVQIAGEAAVEAVTGKNDHSADDSAPTDTQVNVDA
ncbi:hypothetical protein V7R83_04875 [Lautropia mirabilis ATCC 51599]|jgi:hypothetical protein|uniref:Uncharacterized protein n=1 Tax=Lautropia mirabilis ATCC 51599 TaxID=887898 RepID=E7RUU9_9BURK|nr:hypothetical protein [Lautropia mirabilis]EFV95553.1 hypothetical protein HMPREF0551_0461 [Lautropia mirabilis ATCC 51599]VEH03165.1 Uncharacterised protein [Lautropia mirabilis]